MIVATAVFYSLLFAIGWVWIRLQGGGDPVRDGLGEGLALAVAAGLAVGGIVVAASVVTRRRVRWARALETEFREILGERGAAEVVVLALFSGTAEEVFFRGAMQNELGLVWTSLIFGGIHFIPKPVFLPWTVFAIAVGFLLGWIYQVTQNIYAPLSAHVLINGINLWRICGPGAEPISSILPEPPPLLDSPPVTPPPSPPEPPSPPGPEALQGPPP